MSAKASGPAGSSKRTEDRIRLALPGTPRLRSVATLVLGGIGSRLDLPYERVDDLQLAVLSVLAAADVETVTMEIDVLDDEVVVGIGELPAGVSGDRGLARVLERLVDRVEARDTGAEDRGGESTGEWIVLRLGRSALVE